MKIYLKENVLEAGQRRMSRLFDEFDNVVVAFSGGKDSTVTFQLALAEAKKRNRLPLPVVFIDQEAEWELNINYVRSVMNMPEVEPLWIQVSMYLSSGASDSEDWLYCWNPDQKDIWMRDKDDISIHENVYGTMNFKPMFKKVLKHHFKENSCYVGGMRSQENPARHAGMTNRATYKDITWGAVVDAKKDLYTFYPVYDWKITDVWKYINDNKFDYCKIYDRFWQYGKDIHSMRVSHLHHEIGMKDLYYLHEIEPQTWEKLTERISGVNTVRKMSHSAYCAPDKLPYMFSSWKEYRDFLLDKLIQDPAHREKFEKMFERSDNLYVHPLVRDAADQTLVTSVMRSDYHGVMYSTFGANPNVVGYREYKKGNKHPSQARNPFVQEVKKLEKHNDK